MRIARYSQGGQVRWGFVEDDRVRDAGPAETIEVERALGLGLDGIKAVRDKTTRSYSLSEVRLLAPVRQPSKIIGLARNYRDHGADPKAGLQSPILFGMLPSAIIGPGDAIQLPPESQRVDWECELAIVIGPPAKNVRAADALDHVIGYTVVNDVSARDPEIVAGQLFRAKAFDTFKPMGPWITTVDELGDASSLSLLLTVNGVVKQQSSTSNLVAGVRELIEFCSGTFTLLPGDVIASGTPGGTGSSRTPPEFLKDGDEVELQIGGIGSLRNPVRRATQAATSRQDAYQRRDA